MRSFIFLLILHLKISLTISYLIQSDENTHHNTINNPTEQNTPLLMTASDRSIQNNKETFSRLPKAVADGPLTSIDPEIVQILALIDVQSNSIAISPDGETLLLFDSAATSYQFFDISNPSLPVNCSSIPLNATGSGEAAIISFDSKTAYVTNTYVDTGELLIIDISNISAPTIMASHLVPRAADLIVRSPDDRTLFISSSQIGIGVTIFDVSNSSFPTNISVISGIGNEKDMRLSADGTQLFLINDSELYIFDVSVPSSPIYLNGAGVANSACLGISPDGNKAFILIVDWNSLNTTLQIMDTSNSSSIKNISSLSLTDISLDIADIAVSPDANTLFLTGYNTLVIISVLNITNPTYQKVDNLPSPYSVTLSADGRNAFLTNAFQVIITELFFNVQFEQVFDLKPNIINQLQLNGSSAFEAIVLSSNTRTAFVLFQQSLEVIDLSNLTRPVLLSTYTFIGYYKCFSIIMSPDDSAAFISCDQDKVILDLSDLTFPTFIHGMHASGQLSISPDGQIGFLLVSTGLCIMDLSDPSSPVNISAYNFSEGYTTGSFILSNDARTVFILLNSADESSIIRLEIVDLSTLTSPVKLSSTNINAQYHYWPSMTLSPDDEYLIITFANVIIFNVANRATPTQIVWSELVLTDPRFVLFSADMETLFISTEDEFLIIDISKMITPRILRSFSIPQINFLALCPDETTLFILIDTFTIINLLPEYTLYMMESNFLLGEMNTEDLVPLQLNSDREFDIINQRFSFLQVSLYSIRSVPNTEITYPALPNWILFDQAQGSLTFLPNSAAQIGSYQIYATISTQIPKDAFVNIISNITNEAESLDLIASLISMGYMNPKRFLTANFNPNEELFLVSQYSSYASEIQNKLKDYYIEMATSIAIESSLFVRFTDNISVTTVSQNTLSVIITGQPDSNIQFAENNYAALTTISSDKTTISMQGSLIDINTALTQIFMNIDNSTVTELPVYQGVITVSDGLNPVLTQPIDDMVQYFSIFESPIINPNFSIQSEVEQTPILTGQVFMIELHCMFSDPNGQDLVYSIAMQDSSQQVPDWLMLRGDTLTGTPPEKLSQFELKLVLTAANQFKSVSQAFTINIKISVFFTLKLLFTYGGALVTVIGLWIYIYTFYNILCKRRYRYPKDFVIKVGDENSIRDICAITFISEEELRASKIILCKIKKTVAKKLKRRSINDKQLILHFTDPDSGQLNEDKVTEFIMHEMIKINHAKNLAIKEHLRPELVNQLIINQLVIKKLDLKEEKLTKKIFNAIKNDWIHLIEKDSLNFQLNKHKLAKKVHELGVHPYQFSLSQELNTLGSGYRHLVNTSKGMAISQTSNFGKEFKSEDSLGLDSQSSPLESDFTEAKNISSEAQLINHDQKENSKTKLYGINFTLLEKAMMVHAFKYHHLDVDRTDIKIVVNKKDSSGILLNRIWHFLKLDLIKIKFVGGSDTLYGIKFAVQEDILRLSGTPEAVLKNKTLVVQVINRRRKILRELWLNCL